MVTRGIFTNLSFVFYLLAIPPWVILTLGKAAIWRATWQATWRQCLIAASLTNGLWAFFTLTIPAIPIGILFSSGIIARWLPRAWGRQLDAALHTGDMLQILLGIAIVCLLMAIIESLILIGLRKAPVGRSLAAAATANIALCLVIIVLAIVLLSPVVASALRGIWPMKPSGRLPVRP